MIAPSPSAPSTSARRSHAQRHTRARDWSVVIALTSGIVGLGLIGLLFWL